jgi:uncharacterized protein
MIKYNIMMSNKLGIFLAFITFCATIIFSSLVLSRSAGENDSISISTSDEYTINTVNVTAEGEVKGVPDTVKFNVTVSETEGTVESAQSETNKKVAQIRDILSENDIPDENIKTVSLNIYPEYEWKENRRELIGQKATQSLSIQIEDVDESAEKPAIIIDEIVKIDNIRVGQISFDIQDKGQLFQEAREKAYEEAKKKASDLAFLAGRELMKPVSITDKTIDYDVPVYFRAMGEDAMGVGSAENTDISTGEITVKIQIGVLFGLN